MNRQLLESKFPQDQVKQRNGNFGRTLDYIEGHTVIQRLNDAFDGCWSFEIVSYEIMEEEVIVKGRLSAEGVVKTQFGSSTITRNRENGAVVNMADDLKAAATDSLKKCATMLGVGLYLYGVEQEPAGDRSNVRHLDPGQRSGHTAQTDQQQSNPANQSNGDHARISNKQLNYLLDLGKSLQLDSKALDQQALEQFGVRMAYLTRKDASAFIDSLKRKAA